MEASRRMSPREICSNIRRARRRILQLTQILSLVGRRLRLLKYQPPRSSEPPLPRTRRRFRQRSPRNLLLIPAFPTCRRLRSTRLHLSRTMSRSNSTFKPSRCSTSPVATTSERVQQLRLRLQSKLVPVLTWNRRILWMRSQLHRLRVSSRSSSRSRSLVATMASSVPMLKLLLLTRRRARFHLLPPRATRTGLRHLMDLPDRAHKSLTRRLRPTFSSSPAPQETATTATHQFQHSDYGQETQGQQQQQQHVHDAAAASLQFAETHASYQQSSGASYSSATPGNYFTSGAPGAGTAASPAGYSQQQQQQPHYQAQQPQHQQYQQYQEPPQQQQQQHAATGYGYHGGVTQTQPQRTGYNAVNRAGYGAATGHGYASPSLQPSAAPVVKTSNKYKDPCVAPPSCLASFGFGGNVVTMFPKRKLRLNIAGSSYRNSPRGLPAYVL